MRIRHGTRLRIKHIDCRDVAPLFQSLLQHFWQSIQNSRRTDRFELNAPTQRFDLRFDFLRAWLPQAPQKSRPNNQRRQHAKAPTPPPPTRGASDKFRFPRMLLVVFDNGTPVRSTVRLPKSAVRFSFPFSTFRLRKSCARVGMQDFRSLNAEKLLDVELQTSEVRQFNS